MEQQQQQQQQSGSSVRDTFDGLETILPPPRPTSPPPLPPLKRPPGSSGSVTPRSGPPRRPPSRRGSGIQQVSFSELREIFAEEASISGGSPVATLHGVGPDSVATTSMTGSAASQQCATAEAAEERTCALGSSPPRHPALIPSPELATRLDYCCKQAIALLEQLQQPEAQYHRRLEGSSAMPHQLPLRALRYAKGLAFQWTTKAGLGLSLCWGHGFVIARLEGGGWSAPSFFKVRQASIGLTIGAEMTKFLHMLQTPKQLRIFNCDRGVLAFDAAVCLGVDPLEGDVPVRAFTPQANIRDEEEPHTWTLVDGALLDLSLRTGFVFVDETINGALYGNQDPNEVLSGRVAPPPQFGQLYETISRLAASAVLPHTSSKYALAHQRSLAAAERSRSGMLRRTWSSASPHSGARDLSKSSSLGASDVSIGHGGASPGRASPQAGGSFVLFPDVELGPVARDRPTGTAGEEKPDVA